MSGLARPALKSRELLSYGRLFGLKRGENGLVPSFGAKVMDITDVPESGSRMIISSINTVYISADKYVYRTATGTASSLPMYEVSGGVFSGTPDFAHYFSEGEKGYESEADEAGNFILATDGQHAMKFTGTYANVAKAPPVIKPVVHYSRLFGVDKEDAYTVRWSQAGDALGWEYGLNGAGYVKLRATRGKILQLVPCDDRLFAVCEHGLQVLRITGDPSAFEVEVTDTDTDAVIAGTVAVCCGKLLLFTSSGLYAYGGTFERIAEKQLEGFTDPVCAAALQTTYFVSGKLEGSDVIACIDVRSGETCFLNETADCMCAAKSVVFHKSGALCEIVAGSGGSWQSGQTDLGSDCVKYLDSIIVNGTAEKLTVSACGRTRVFNGASGRVKVGLTGRFFEISAECKGGLYGLTANYAERH